MVRGMKLLALHRLIVRYRVYAILSLYLIICSFWLTGKAFAVSVVCVSWVMADTDGLVEYTQLAEG